MELLGKRHKREAFDCGNSLLNTYLQTQANQDMRRKLSACFVYAAEDGIIQGYYTLSNDGISLNRFPEHIKSKLPRSYRSIPVTLIGRLAIDKQCQGQGLGKVLLIDALKRAWEVSKEIGSFAVVVDPIDAEAEKFYAKFDFIPLPDSRRRMIAMKTLNELFA